MSGPGKQSTPAEGVRLDKWLWAARFFKTRQLANEAIAGGKVHLNGQRTKPGKDVTVGATLEISKDHFSWEITVIALSGRRGPAKEAVLLYEETPESLAKRQAEIDRRRAEQASDVVSDGRPNKRDRRLIHRFKDTLG
ncbi:RNA-binding S4 domain-containing protein [Methylolobus aquaticus]